MTDKRIGIINSHRIPVIGVELDLAEGDEINIFNLHENPIVAIDVLSQAPWQAELLTIRKAIPTTFMRSYKPEIIEDVMRAPMPVMRGHNTYVLCKHLIDAWCYRRLTRVRGDCLWIPGPTYRWTLDELLENIRIGERK